MTCDCVTCLLDADLEARMDAFDQTLAANNG